MRYVHSLLKEAGGGRREVEKRRGLLVAGKIRRARRRWNRERGPTVLPLLGEKALPLDGNLHALPTTSEKNKQTKLDSS